MGICNRNWAGILTVVLCLAPVACKKSDATTPTGTGGTGSSAGHGSGSGGSSAGTGSAGTTTIDPNDAKCINADMDNTDCSTTVTSEPQTGDCAPKGTCCHRASNIAREKLLGPDDSVILEYSLHYNQTINHPKTISTGLALSSNLALYVGEQQNTLWRFKLPRKGGMEVSGDGEMTIGYGAYNCNGTYSLYSDTAAPNGALSMDPTRWSSKPMPMKVDVSKSGWDRYHIAFADEMKRREFINLPYVDTSKDTFPLDWELSFMGFHMISFKTEDAGHDCAGSVGGGANGWTPGGQFEVYTPVFGNNKSVITALGVTYCTLVSFGIGAAKGLNCESEPRCTPGSMNGSTKCPWVKLPDSLCPKSADEMGMFNCHLAAKGNVNAEDKYPSDTDLNCTDTAPTAALDPDKGATSNGQCCDPMGTSTTLPACNAHHLLIDFVAAAAKITQKPTDQLQTNCALKK